jgi:hypothetical protein
VPSGILTAHTGGFPNNEKKSEKKSKFTANRGRKVKITAIGLLTELFKRLV